MLKVEFWKKKLKKQKIKLEENNDIAPNSTTSSTTSIG